MTCLSHLPKKAYQQQTVCQRAKGLHWSIWESKLRTSSYSKAGGVAAFQERAQNKESRARLILETTSATSPMIPEQAHSDKAGLKSNPEVRSEQGLNQQSTRLGAGTAAVEFGDQLPDLICSPQAKQGGPVLLFTALSQDFLPLLHPRLHRKDVRTSLEQRQPNL